jgi:serpin B
MAKRMRTALVSLLVMAALAGCDSGPTVSAREDIKEQAPPPPFDESNLPFSDFGIEANPSDDARKMVAGEVQFAADLYGKLASEPGDLFVSPASIWSAFGLAHAATAGETAQEIGAALHYPAIKGVDQANGELLKTMNFQVQGRALLVGNAMWLQNGFPVKPAFQSLMTAHYGAALKPVDFKTAPDAARDQINQWIAVQTRDRIRDAVRSEDVSDLTRTMLVNTAYFKAGWQKEFEPLATKTEDFIRADGTKVKTQLMNQQSRFSIITERGFKAVSLPYVQGETDMVVILPDRADGLPAVERAIAGGQLPTTLAKLGGDGFAEVILTLPKFRMEQRRQLKDIMAHLGVKALFSPTPDFSAMSSEPLEIGAVIHQTFVEVDESGTEAAAATFAEAAAAAAVFVEPPKPIIFRADHPFLFLIRDSRTGMILFMGRYTGMAVQ